MNIPISTKREHSSGDGDAAVEIVPPEIRRVLGKPPLLPGESEESFEELLALVVSALKPNNMLEWISAWDVSSLTFEIRRLQRWKAALFWREHKGSLKSVLEQDIGFHAGPLISQWSAGEARAREKVRALLEAHEFGREEIAIMTLHRYDSFVERIDNTIAKISSRRDAALRELDRRRDRMAERLRRDLEVVDLAPTSK
jgi:hypothetical protein